MQADPRQHESRQAGFSLVSILISLAILTMIGLMVTQTSKLGLRSAASSNQRQDISTLKNLVRENLNCDETLGVTPATPLPISCPAGPVIMRRKSSGGGAQGTPLAPSNLIGNWTVTASCTGGEIIVAATRPGTDPLTERPWSSSPYATDLFEGTSDFCSNYFVGGPACVPPNKLMNLGNGAVCVNLTAMCTAMGFDYNAANNVCVPKLQHTFGGTYQRGESHFAGWFCESPNPQAGNTCGCPAGFTDLSWNFSCESNDCSRWDENHICFKM